MADDIVIKTAPAQRLLAVEREIPGFGPDNIVPVLNPAYDELAGIVAAMGLDPDRVYLSCYDVSGADAGQPIEEHGYRHVGPGRDFYLELNDDEPSKQVFEIQAPLRRPSDPVPAVAPQRAG